MTQPLIGSHLSTAGGWDKLIERSHEEHGTTFAFFPCSPYGRRSKALDPDGAAAFGAHLKTEHYGPLVVHAPYVYNFAGKDEGKRAFAIDALAEDMRLLAPIRAAGQETYLNIHPGSHVGQGTENGCRLIADALNHVAEQACDTGIPILPETMAGKGTECGRSFEEIASIISQLDNPEAGYDLVDDYDGVIRQLDDVIGLGKIKAIHANDSMYGLASHKDRHANIGDGKLGLQFFTRLVNDPRLNTLPMILEPRKPHPTRTAKKSHCCETYASTKRHTTTRHTTTSPQQRDNRTMNTNTTPTALIITANPEHHSLTNAAGKAFAEGFRAHGGDTDTLDLYDAGFNPVYTSADRAHYLGKADMPEDVAAIQTRLAQADVITLVFPIYWYTMPAMIKGLFDRVICRGFAYNADGTPGALAGKTVRVIMLTGGPESWYKSDGIGEALDNQIRRQMLRKYCGVEDTEIIYVDNLSMGDDDPAKREAAAAQLARIEELGASLA